MILSGCSCRVRRSGKPRASGDDPPAIFIVAKAVA